MATRAQYDHSLRATLSYKIWSYLLGIIIGIAIMKIAVAII